MHVSWFPSSVRSSVELGPALSLDLMNSGIGGASIESLDLNNQNDREVLKNFIELALQKVRSNHFSIAAHVSLMSTGGNATLFFFVNSVTGPERISYDLVPSGGEGGPVLCGPWDMAD